MAPFKIFIAEDDRWYAKALQYHLALNKDYEVTVYQNGKELLNELHQNPQVITLDYRLPDMNGEMLLKKIKEVSPKTEVLIISGQEDVSIAMDLLTIGAYDYIVKNSDTKKKVWNSILKIKENYLLKNEVQELKDKVSEKYKSENMLIGKSKSMIKIHQLIAKAANTSINISITGNTGTGKELVAQAIHYNSEQKQAPFIAINVAAIPSELIESELFGHEKGAFSGAHNKRIGKFELAKNGTLFLDEIGEMDLNMQSKLLRVLQEKEICRVGGNQSIKVKCRIITATHKNLLEEVKKGNFRQDLYYRLIGLPIALPTLKEREGDILLLAKHFLDTYCKENKQKLKFSAKGIQKMLKYDYPGNVRELKAMIDLAAVLAENDTITEDNICFQDTNTQTGLFEMDKPLKDLEKEIIRHYLNKCNFNVIQAAKKLEIGKSTIYRLIKDDPAFFEHRTYLV